MKVCQQCGKAFIPDPPSRPAKYCSFLCYSEWRKKNITIKVCQRCGEEFITHHRRRPRNYCSSYCSSEARRKIKGLKICQQCGGKFIPKGHRQDAKYCSRDCYREAKKTVKPHFDCLYCGKEFIPKSYRPSYPHKYCSQVCSQEAKKRRVRLICKQCRTEFEIRLSHAKQEYCSRKCLFVSRIQHGMSHSPEFNTWNSIIQRCHNHNNPAYEYYGGRGIRVCEEWRQSFVAFYEYMGPRPTPRHQIDRINNDGNYEPGNCRWVLPEVNARNKRGPKLGPKKAKEIRQLYETGHFTYQQLAKRFGVVSGSIGLIIRGKTWRR